MQPFSGLLLDIDNTLYSYPKAHDAALEVMLGLMHQVLNVEMGKLYELYKEARHHIHKMLKGTAASHNRLLYIQHMMELLGLKPFGLPYRLYNLYWSTFFDHMVPMPGVLEFLARLDGVPVCLVTDMTADIQHQKVIRLGIEPFVQYMVTSEEVGHEKPHPKIFQRALKKLGLSASEVCMIGDSYEKDILGAAEAGISACWLVSEDDHVDVTGVDGASPVGCVTFTHFDQLHDRLGAMQAGTEAGVFT